MHSACFVISIVEVVFSLQHFISWYHAKLCGVNSTLPRVLLRLFHHGR
jgi:hypothetical protein